MGHLYHILLPKSTGHFAREDACKLYDTKVVKDNQQTKQKVIEAGIWDTKSHKHIWTQNDHGSMWTTQFQARKKSQYWWVDMNFYCQL